MTDIASLGFAVDSTQVKSAQTDLRGMRDAGSAAADAAVKLEQAARSANPALQEFARGAGGATTSLRQQSSVLDELINRVNAYAGAMQGLRGPLAELTEASTRLDVVGRAFNTSATGMENFGRAARQMGLDASETVSALQRIQAALAGVTAEGQAARRVLLDYGVRVDGRGPNDADRVMREFVSNARGYRADNRSTLDMQTVLGPTAIDSTTSLLHPEFTSFSQRRATMRADDNLRAAAATREAAVEGIMRQNRRGQELEDLRGEFGRFQSQGWFQSNNAYRTSLEVSRAQGMIPQSQQDRDAYFGLQRGIEWMNDPRRQANSLAIGLAEEREHDNDRIPVVDWAMTRMTANARRIGNFFGRNVAIPTDGAAVQLANDRTGNMMRQTNALSFQGGLDARQQSQQQELIQFGASEWGADINGWDLRSPERILAGLTPGRRAAAEGRWTARDWVMGNNSERMMAAAQAPRTAFAGAMDQGPMGADRARFEEDARQRLEADSSWNTVAGRGNELRRQMAQYDAQIADARNKTTVAIRAETQAIQSSTEAIRASLSAGGTGGQALAAGTVANYASDYARSPGSASPADRAAAAAARVADQAAQRTGAGRDASADSAALATLQMGGPLQAGYGEQVRELTVSRDLYNEIVKAELARGQSLAQATAMAREMTAELRAQAAENDRMAAQRAASNGGARGTGTLLSNLDRGGNTPFGNTRRDFDYRWAEENLQDQLRGPDGNLLPADATAEREQAARRLLRDPALRGRADAAFEQSLGRGRMDTASQQAAARRAAGIGITGNPNLDRFAGGARLRMMAGAETGDPQGLLGQAGVADADASGAFTRGSQGLIYNSNQAGNNAALVAATMMRDERSGVNRGDLWRYESDLRTRGELSGGALRVQDLGDRRAALRTEGAGQAIYQAQRTTIGTNDDADDLRGLADAARKSGQAYSELAREQAIVRENAELLSRARAAETEATRLMAEGNTAAAQAARAEAEALRGTAAAAREAAEGKNAAKDAGFVGSESLRLEDQNKDLTTAAGASWFRSNASVDREVSRTQYERRVRAANPGIDDTDVTRMADLNEEGQKLAKLATDARQVRDSFSQIGTAAFSALETIAIRGGNARQVMGQLAAQVASIGFNALAKQASSKIGDWLSTGISAAIGYATGGPAGGISAAAMSGLQTTAANNTAGGAAGLAQGGAFWGGGLRAMATGAIVDSMTLRPMANGDTAMMGEAGPEAVLPLARLPSGNLGVRAGGGGGGGFSPTVIINLPGGGPGGGGTSPEQARMVAEAAQGAMKQFWDEHMRDATRVGGQFNPIYSGGFGQS